MAGNVKGITVEIGGDTSKLGKALQTSEKQSRDLQKELKQVNTALKFNPDSIELLTQKQQILTDQIQATKEKLDILKEAESQVEAQFNAGEIGEEQFRAFQREIVETESKLKTYTSQLEETGKKASSLDQLTDSISDQEKKVEDLKTEWKNAVLTYGEGSDEANALAKEIDELSTELKENKSKMSELDKAADKLDNSLEEVEESTDETSGGFTVMKGALADLVSKGIQTAISALKDLASAALDAYEDFDEGQDNVIKATGATGKAAEELSASYKNVAKSVVGDLGDIGSALGEVNTRFGFTGQELEDASVQFMKFSEITGVDATEAVKLVSRAMEGAGIDSKEYATVLDQLAVAGQASGTSIDKLAENLTKFGTPMREMGLSTEESIAMLAQFEKAGVNTEVALGGMRKALVNWSKDGKDAGKEFGKVVKQIKDAPSTTEATAIAIENFGSKAGPELAEAIQTGRFEYSDFLDLIEGSAGAVTNTYEETQDGFDKIRLAIQGVRADMGDFVGQLLDKYQPQIEQAISAGVELIKTAVKTVIENFDTIKAAAQIIVPALAAVFAINKISTFISSINTLKETFTALWGVMAANPIGIVAVALGALVTASIAAAKAHERYLDNLYGLNDEEQALVDKINAEKSALDEAAGARLEANKAIEAETGHNQALWKELQNITDENGNIKKGYEDRAAVITGLLAESLGIEIEIVDGQIQKYDELKQTIENVIQTKRAEALLDASKQDYTDAISKSAEAYSTYSKAVKDAEKTQKELTAAEENANAIRAKMTDGIPETYYEMEALNYQYGEAQQAVDKLSEKYETQSKAVSDAEENYLKYANTIENYEGAMAALASGDVDQLSAALDRLSNNFVTAENATQEMLESQLSNFQTQYAAMKEAVEAGMPGVTQAQVDAMGNLVTAAEKELDKLAPETGKRGKRAGDAVAEGLDSTTAQNEKIAKKIADRTKSGLESSDTNSSGKKKGNEYASGLDSTTAQNEKIATKVAEKTKAGLESSDTKTSGSKKGTQYSEGVDSTSGKANTAGKNVSSSANKGMDSADTKGTGSKKGKEYSAGMEGTSGTASGAGKAIANAAKKGAETISLTASGQTGGDQYSSGVSSKNSSANSAGKNLASNAKSGAESVSANGSGENFGQGFINGIGSKLAGAIAKARELAANALQAVKNRIAEGSPSKITTQSGKFFGQGFINGIRDKIPGAAKAARDMAEEAINSLDFPDVTDVINDYPGFDASSFDRQLETTFNGSVAAPDFSAILERLDAVEDAIRNSRSAIVLDTGVLVGETINQIDNGLADTYALKARGI